MKILVVSYRDMEHPEAGGAEVIIYEIMQRLAARGHDVTLLTGGFRGGAARAVVGGAQVHRTGNTFNFNFAAPAYYRRRLKKRGFDLIVEDLNKIPFFSPSFQRDVPVLANVPHLFGTTVFREAAWPIGLYVYLHERFIPASYGRCRFQVLSDSTRDDLIARGIPAEQVHVIRCGIDRERYVPPERKGAPAPVILYLGRLKKYKGIELAIEALPKVHKTVPHASYWIAGEGSYRGALESTISRLGLSEHVQLLGHRGGEEKLDLLRRRVFSSTHPRRKAGGFP